MALTRPKYSQIYDTDYKQSVRLATTADVGNLLATGNMTNSVDGRTVLLNDRILVKDQIDSKQNGIYRVAVVGTGSNGTWLRALDADTSEKVTSGLTTTIADGDANAYKTFKLGTPDPITLGSTLLSFVNPFDAGAGTVAGSNQSVQFNDFGVAGGTAGLTFNKLSNVLTITGNVNSTGYFIGNIVTGTGPIEGSIYTLDSILNIESGTSNIRTYSSGNITVSPAGTANIAVFTASNIYVSGSIIPAANVAYDLGSPTQRFRSGYFSGNTVYIGSESISVDSTGKWTFTSGGSSVDFGANVTFNPTSANISGNLIVGGNLTVNGVATYLNVDNIVTQDPLIYLADGNTTDFLDIGVIGNFTRASTYQHTGIARDATDGVWKLFENVVPEPTTTIDFGSATYTTLKLGNVVTTGNIITGSNLRINGALLTSTGAAGTAGQYLTSTGAGLAWTTLEISSSAISDATNSSNVVATSDSVDVWANSTQVVTMTNQGVGIGTNNPQYPLHVKSSDNAVISVEGTGESFSQISMLAANSLIATNNTIQSGTGGEIPHWTITGAGVANTLMIRTGGTERMRIDSSGNVGIGTNNPTKKLSVVGSASVTGDIYTGPNGFDGSVYAGTIFLSDTPVVVEAGDLYLSGDKILTNVTSPYLGLNSIIRTNATTIAANITIPSGTNGMSAGPITIASGVVVTVTGDWSIV